MIDLKFDNKLYERSLMNMSWLISLFIFILITRVLKLGQLGRVCGGNTLGDKQARRVGVIRLITRFPVKICFFFNFS